MFVTLQIRAFHEKYYRLDNMVIVISGRMTPGELTSCILAVEDAYMLKVQQTNLLHKNQYISMNNDVV
jgi:Zn-dependent M16 (insulinase) family peptidase